MNYYLIITQCLSVLTTINRCFYVFSSVIYILNLLEMYWEDRSEILTTLMLTEYAYLHSCMCLTVIFHNDCNYEVCKLIFL